MYAPASHFSILNFASRIRLLCVDFSPFDRGAHGTRPAFARGVSTPVSRPRSCLRPIERIVSIDSDMLIRHAGLGRLAEFDLGGAPIAAAYDMIFLMDFNGGALRAAF